MMAIWDGSDDRAQILPSNIYLEVCQAGTWLRQRLCERVNTAPSEPAG